MRVLMVSTDRKLFEKNSSVRGRILSYGSLVDELHIIVFSTRNHDIEVGKVSLGGGVYLYHTASINRWLYVFDAIKLGKKIFGSIDDKQELKKFVITTQDPFETGLVGKALSRKFDIPLQVQIHTDFLSPYFKKQSYLNRLRLFISKGVIKRARNIRVVSERIARSLVVSKYKSRANLHTLPVFVDVIGIKNQQADFDLHDLYSRFKNIILVTSRLEPEKNVALAIRVFEKVMEKYPETGLIIVGDGSERAKLEAMGVRNVVFTGWQENLTSYYKTADIFLNTSRYEGYGMALVEAIAGGSAVVTTDVGIVGDVLVHGESALVCGIDNDECLAGNLVRLIENPELRNKIVCGANDSLEKNFISKQQYLSVFKSQLINCGYEK